MCLFSFCYFPEVYSGCLEQGVVSIPDAVDLLLSLTGFIPGLLIFVDFQKLLIALNGIFLSAA